MKKRKRKKRAKALERKISRELNPIPSEKAITPKTIYKRRGKYPEVYEEKEKNVI